MHKIIGITLFCLVCTAVSPVANASTPLEQSMKRMATAYHQLDKDLKQPVEANKPDYLALVATMKTEAQTSRGLVPKKIKEMPTDQQAAQVTAFQKSIDDLGASIDALNQDITASKWDDATKQIATLKQQMVDGHKKFRKPEPHDAPAPAAAAPAPAAP